MRQRWRSTLQIVIKMPEYFTPVFHVTQAHVIVTSHDLLPRFKNLLPSIPSITHIIYLEDQLQKTSTEGFG